jgi:hypothetical protein
MKIVLNPLIPALRAAALILCFAPLSLIAAAPGPESAYQALRTVASQRGEDTLKHVIEVEGRAGVPQPVVWRIVLDDPTARGGVREFEVAHGKIVSEHTPVRTYSGSAAGALIDFHKLNLDSSGAFTVAEKEAQRTHVGFDSVDYILRTGDGPDATPVWVLHMMDSSHHSIGTLSVTYAGSPPPAPPSDYTVQETDHDNLYNPAGEPSPVRRADDTDTEDTQGLRIGHRIKTVILSAGESLKNFVTGQSSSDH